MMVVIPHGEVGGEEIDLKKSRIIGTIKSIQYTNEMIAELYRDNLYMTQS